MRLAVAIGSSGLALALAVGCGSNSGDELFAGAGPEGTSQGGGGIGSVSGDGGDAGDGEGGGGQAGAAGASADDAAAAEADASDDAERADASLDAEPDASVEGGDEETTGDAGGQGDSSDLVSEGGSTEGILVPGEVPCGDKTCKSNTKICCTSVVTIASSVCLDANIPCTTGVSFACDEPADCPSDQTCCGQVGILEGFYTVKCRATCDPNQGQTIVCSPAKSNCPDNMACVKDSSGAYFICKK